MYNPNSPALEQQTPSHVPMSDDDFIQLGTGEVAYLRPIGPHELGTLFPQVPPISGHVLLYALFNADGTPMMLADTKDALLANAFENELQMVSTH